MPAQPEARHNPVHQTETARLLLLANATYRRSNERKACNSWHWGWVAVQRLWPTRLLSVRFTAHCSTRILPLRWGNG